MPLIRINTQPSRNQLILFGGAWLVFFGIWGFLASAKGSPVLARGLWILAGAVPLVGLVVPGLMRLVFVGLSYATYPIGFVVSHVVLAILYYLVFTPIGLIMRLLRYDPLSRRFAPKAPSYWKERANPKSVASYFRQD
jgi:hypothetical protein